MPFAFFSLFFLFVTACQHVPPLKPSSIDFPELSFNTCPVAADRSPSSLCSSETEEDHLIKTSDDVMSQFENRMQTSDVSFGRGFSNASFYVRDQEDSLQQGSPDSSFWARNQVVEFYKAKNASGKKARSGSAILGTPTRIYLTPQGDLAYVAFDRQAVSLLEVSGDQGSLVHSKIPNHGQAQHANGFSSPVGRMKGFADEALFYTPDELEIFIGKKGQQVKIEFESGVTVEGVIDHYGTSLVEGNESFANLVVFKPQTCEVNFGNTTLFSKEDGVYTLLFLPQISQSLSRLSLGK